MAYLGAAGGILVLAAAPVSFVDSRSLKAWCINQAAHKVKPDAIVTGNVKDFQLSDYPVFDCATLFKWLEEKHGKTYALLDLPE